MSAQAMSGDFKSSHVLKAEIENILVDVNAKLEQIEFLVNPLQTGYQTPMGFHTVGFTRVLLPEFYVSGIAVNDAKFREIYPFMKSLFGFLSVTGSAMQPSSEVCRVINEQFVHAGLDGNYQARPVDTERLLYGQGQMLRRWLDKEGYRDEAQAIQIVWRDDDSEWPVISTERQLLLDYVPFGTKCPNPPVGAEHNVFANPTVA